MKLPLSALALLVLVSLAGAQNYNTTLIANIDDYSQTGYTDCWGYTAPDGREYALIGVNALVSILDVTDPANITEVATVPFVNAGWYDMKTYQHYMYVSSEGSNSIRIVDLSGLPGSVSVVGDYGNFATTLHNVYIDTSAALLYAVEDFHFSKPVTIISLADPENPVEVGALTPASGPGTDAHDVFARGGRLYVAEGINQTIGIFDVSDPSMPSLLQRLSIPNAGYVHNVWVSADDHYMVTTEETAGKTIKVWDIQDLNNITLLDEYLGENQLAHNAYFRGDYLFISHYYSGLKIVDVSDPTHLVEVGNYDTIEGSNPSTFGNWGVYPFASNGLIYVNDMASGAYIVSFNNVLAYRVRGVVKDAQSGLPISQALIEVLESGNRARSDAGGHYKIGYGGDGPITLVARAYGYVADTLSLNAVQGQTDLLDISLQPAPRNDLSGTIVDENGAPLGGIPLHLTINSFFFNEPLVVETFSAFDGSYSFANLAVSDSIWAAYPELRVEDVFPYNGVKVNDIIITAAAPTVQDFQFYPADLLLVNDDPAGQSDEIYRSIFNTLNLTAFDWKTSQRGEDIPAASLEQLQYPVVIWFTGTATEAIGSAGQDSLARILDDGGRVYLTGRDLVEALASQGGNFLQDYLQVSHAGNWVGAPVMNPVAGNPVTGGLGTLIANQPSRDILLPDPGSSVQPAVTYFDGQTAALSREMPSGGGRLFLSGFGFESLTNVDMRTGLMSALLNWFGVPVTGVDPLPAAAPQQFELAQNYPNPFNPETVIRYQLSGVSDVELNVFNLLGQKVVTLIDARQGAGEYRVRWDGRDRRGAPVPSGVYFYRLESGQNSITRKMILLR